MSGSDRKPKGSRGPQQLCPPSVRSQIWCSFAVELPVGRAQIPMIAMGCQLGRRFAYGLAWADEVVR
jgi:hypothetical protein